MSNRNSKLELYPRIHRHIVEWMLIALLLRGAYDVLMVLCLGHV